MSPNVLAVVVALTGVSIFFWRLLSQYPKGQEARFPLETGIIVFVHPVEWFERGQNESDASLDQRVGLRRA
jgi:hypothetical protein